MKAARPYPIVTITPKGERAIVDGHPWVYEGEVVSVSGTPEDGGLVDVVSKKGSWLGCGFYNSASKIRVRLVTRNANDDPAGDAFWERRLRYAWFDELSREHGYTVVAIAHHIDDSIETFFINLLRGTGLRGLTGITTHAGKLIRPLMFASRKDILEYAVAQHIPYREDSSNRSTKYLRNKIRLGLVPRIKEISPKFTDLMRQNIGRLTDAQLFINHGIQRIREEVITTENGIDTIHIDRIDRAFPLNFVIFELLNSTYSFKGDVSDALVRALEQNSGTGKRFYSKSHVAYIDRGRIMVTPIPADDPCQVQVEAGAPRCYCGNSVLYYEYCDIDTIKNSRASAYPNTSPRWMPTNSNTRSRCAAGRRGTGSFPTACPAARRSATT